MTAPGGIGRVTLGEETDAIFEIEIDEFVNNNGITADFFLISEL